MATYSDIIAGLTIGSYGNTGPAELTSRFDVGVSLTTTVSTDPDAPGGKKLNITHGGSTVRSFFSIDAIDADPDRGTCTSVMLIRVNSPSSGGTATYGGIGSRGNGDGASETLGASNMARNSSDQRVTRAISYTSGSASTTDSSAINIWVQGEIYLLKQIVSGTTMTTELYNFGDYVTPINSFSRSCPASNANNWIGIFSFASQTNIDILYMSVGTGADQPDLPPADAEPVLTDATGTSTGETTASGSVTTDTASGTLYAVVTTSATAPSKPDIIAGTGAVYSTSQIVTASGVQNVNASGLTAETTYYWHFLHDDSNVATSNSFTTDAVPVTPPATAPTGLSAVAQSDTVIRLTWDALAGVTGYKIRVDGVSVTDVGNVLTFDVTGLTPETQYGFEVLGYNSAGDGPYSSPPVLETTEATPNALTLITEFDAGNVSQTLTTIINPEAAEPRVEVQFRPAAITGTNGSGWTIASFAVNAGGKRPVFVLPRADLFSASASISLDYLPSYTQDFVTFTQAPSRSLVGGSSGTIEFQFTDPLPAGTVYILTHPIGQQAAAAPYAAALLANYPSVVSPTGSADANGVYFTSPAELDENGRECGGHDIYALKFEFGGSTTDGGPKRKAVISYGQHAMGEAQAWFAFKSFIEYLLDSTDAEAVRDRANFDYYVYFNITPNGIFAGHRRTNPTRTQDPNRQWLASPVLVEIAATKNAIIADTGGSINVSFDFHGASSRQENFIVFSPANPNNARFIELGEAVFGETVYYVEEEIVGSMAAFCIDELNADFASATEMQGRGDTSLANYQDIGQKWAKTLAAADADGMFYTPPPNESSFNSTNTSVSSFTYLPDLNSSFSSANASSSSVTYTADEVGDKESSFTSTSASLSSFAYSVSLNSSFISYNESTSVFTALTPTVDNPDFGFPIGSYGHNKQWRQSIFFRQFKR